MTLAAAVQELGSRVRRLRGFIAATLKLTDPVGEVVFPACGGSRDQV
jgi:hypothetical protein